MNKVILHLDEEGEVVITYPVKSFLDMYNVSIEDIGKKTVIEGNPFWIVDHEDIPKDILETGLIFDLDLSCLGDPSGIGVKEDYYINLTKRGLND